MYSFGHIHIHVLSPQKRRNRGRELDGSHIFVLFFCNLILGVVFYPLKVSHYIQSALRRRGTLKDMNVRGWKSLGAILEAAYQSHYIGFSKKYGRFV